MLGFLTTAKSSEIVLLFITFTLTTNVASSIYFYYKGKNQERTKCDLEKQEAENEARANADRVNNVADRGEDNFNTQRDIAFNTITETDLQIAAQSAKRVGQITGYEQGQKDAFESIEARGGCLVIPYTDDSELFNSAQDLQSLIFGSRETSSD